MDGAWPDPRYCRGRGRLRRRMPLLERVEMSWWDNIFGPTVAEQTLAEVRALKGIVMSEFQNLENDNAALLAAIGGVSDRIAAYAKQVADLEAQIAAGVPVTAEQVATLRGQLQAETATLSALASPPPNPAT